MYTVSFPCAREKIRHGGRTELMPMLVCGYRLGAHLRRLPFLALSLATSLLPPSSALWGKEGQFATSSLPCSTSVPRFRSFLTMERLWSCCAVDRNKALVENLQTYGVIKTKKVTEVMETIDRGLFVPSGNDPYFDRPMSIDYNATISAPHMHATCLESLEDHLQLGMRALDVGSGTGYLTACFALMVGSEGRAVGVEHIPELAASSIENIKRSAAEPLLEQGVLSIHVRDGHQGWPELAPYNAIHVGAAASEIPPPLIKQLKPGGRMVIPVGNLFQDLQVVDKRQDGSVNTRIETSVRYVPLTSRTAQLQG